MTDEIDVHAYLLASNGAEEYCMDDLPEITLDSYPAGIEIGILSRLGYNVFETPTRGRAIPGTYTLATDDTFRIGGKTYALESWTTEGGVQIGDGQVLYNRPITITGDGKMTANLKLVD